MNSIQEGITTLPSENVEILSRFRSVTIDGVWIGDFIS
jgi:hypothetical protein